VKTVDKLQHILPAGVPADYLDQLRRLLPTEQINEGFIYDLMQGIIVDDDVFSFCDIMERLSDQNTHIECFRNGKLHIFKAIS